MNYRPVGVIDIATRAASTMRAASQALSLMEEISSEGELCGLLARALSSEADSLERELTAHQEH